MQACLQMRTFHICIGGARSEKKRSGFELGTAKSPSIYGAQSCIGREPAAKEANKEVDERWHLRRLTPTRMELTKTKKKVESLPSKAINFER